MNFVVRPCKTQPGAGRRVAPPSAVQWFKGYEGEKGHLKGLQKEQSPQVLARARGVADGLREAEVAETLLTAGRVGEEFRSWGGGWEAACMYRCVGVLWWLM